MPVSLVFLCAGLIGAVGCANIHESKDFERHRASQIVIPPDAKDIFYFDAVFSPGYPDNDPAAEARRMEWLASWMEARKMCPSGHEVVNRRAFRFEESNPGRYDIRYEVRCKVGHRPAVRSGSGLRVD
ncbi:MAG: hypothetical protein QNJ73_11000 [Gammaproteobacteria bacterium]|nr:hypothetical protein [Gammaproteobacteria bacterium]